MSSHFAEQKLFIYLQILIIASMDNRIYSYTSIYSYSKFCVGLSEMWSFILNMP